MPIDSLDSVAFGVNATKSTVFDVFVTVVGSIVIVVRSATVGLVVAIEVVDDELPEASEFVLMLDIVVASIGSFTVTATLGKPETVSDDAVTEDSSVLINKLFVSVDSFEASVVVTGKGASVTFRSGSAIELDISSLDATDSIAGGGEEIDEDESGGGSQ